MATATLSLSVFVFLSLSRSLFFCLSHYFLNSLLSFVPFVLHCFFRSSFFVYVIIVLVLSPSHSVVFMWFPFPLDNCQSFFISALHSFFLYLCRCFFISLFRSLSFFLYFFRSVCSEMNKQAKPEQTLTITEK